MTESSCPTDQDKVPDHEAHRQGKRPQVKRFKRISDRLTNRLALVGPCAIPGISLTNYNINAQSKGWGAPCTQARTTITLSNGVRVTVASRIARLSTLVLNEAIRRGYVIRQADTGAYNCRYISGTRIWSNHAWAIAIDVNWQTNPFTTSRITDKPDWLFKLFNRYGFANGADYSGRHDWMHHEFMGSPAQADQATALAERELGAPQPAKNPVLETQRALHFLASESDGIWGDQTERGVNTIRNAVNNQFPYGVPEAQTRVGTASDGVWGPGSEAALTNTIKALQAAWGATVDGAWGPNTEARWQANRSAYYTALRTR